MNSLRHEQIFMRSIATRERNRSTSAILEDALAYLRSAAFDLVIVETAGIGQSDSEIVDLVDLPVYVMTSEFGAASQLEKIDMLDLAEIVVINKFDKRGALDALRDVRKQWRRNHVAFEIDEDRDSGLPDDRKSVPRSRTHVDVHQPLHADRPATRGPTRIAGMQVPARVNTSRSATF